MGVQAPGGAGAAPQIPTPEGASEGATKLRERGQEMADQMMEMQMAMMEVQHQQAMNNIIATASSAISKDSADTAKSIANKIG